MTTYNWYFSQAGHDAYGNGSIGNPWKSLSKAQNQINTANTEDVVNLFFKRGDVWKFNTGQRVFFKVLTFNPIVNIDNYGSEGNKPIFDGNILNGDFSVVPRSNDNNDYRFYYATFQFEKVGCSMKNIELRNVYGVGIRVSSGFTCHGNTIHHIGYAAITKMKKDIVTGCLIEKNLVYNIVELSKYNRFVMDVPFWPSAIAIWCDDVGCGDSYDNIFRYNIIYNVYGEGITCGGSLVEYNIIGDTGSVGIYPVPSINDAHDAIVRYNLVTMSNSPEYKKLIGSTYKGIEVRDENIGGYNTNATIQVYGNIVINRKYGLIFSERWRASPFKEVKIFNNTVIDSASANFVLGNGYDMIIPGNGHWYNNASILYDRPDSVHAADFGDPTDLSDYWTIDNNLFWTRGGSPVVDASWRKNAIIADPKLIGGNVIDWTGQSGPTYFKDIKFSDLYPMADSPLIGSGKPLDESFDNIYLTQGTDFSTLPNVPKFSLAMQPEVGNWDLGAIITSGINLCAGVVCDNICIGNDLWSQKCVNGACFLDQLIQQNSSTCGYDPCAGVVCDNICIGNDLWSQKCVNGDCFLDLLIEQNSSTCGYDPCAGVVCDNICQGNDLWSQKCVSGECVLDQLVEQNSSTCGPDPCAGVVCDNICQGNDLWSQKCVNGACFLDQLVQQNSSTCGPDPCAGVVCDNICQGNDLWSQKCVNGACFLDQLIEQNSVTCDLGPCENVFCHNTCVGYDLWSQICDPETGVCKVDQLLESNSATCMVTDYIPTDESTIKLYLVLGGLAFAGLGAILLAKK